MNRVPSIQKKSIMPEPFFTVVIPTHNRHDLLRHAIDSVLKQSFESFELIVVDDHSTDNTRSVVGSFEDARIRYLENDRTKGAAGARNVGIIAAKGKWVAFLDDDDTWMQEKLKAQYERIEQNEKNVGMICTDYVIHKGNEHKSVIIKNRPSGWIREKLH